MPETLPLSPVAWFPAELSAWTPPPEMTVSEWADQHRVLSSLASARSGQWRTALVPYAKAPMNAFSDRGVSEITLMWATQVSKTELLLNMLGYAIHIAPGPAMWIMPKAPDYRKIASRRVHPMITSSPTLSARILGEVADSLLKTECLFDRMFLAFASAQTPADLAGDPMRYVFRDEIDKYPAQAGEEADPMELSDERTNSFSQVGAKKVNACTPTFENGNINKKFQRSTKEFYYVPCPVCGNFQTLKFGGRDVRHGIKWPKDATPEEIRGNGLAWYECEFCHERIDERFKTRMLASEKWVSSVYQRIDPKTGMIFGDLPRQNLHRGFHLSALYSPFLTWADNAAKWLEAQGNPKALMNFINSRLAEVWKEIAVSKEAGDFDGLRVSSPRGVVPAHALAITAGVDMQGDHFRFAVWAHGRSGESWAIDYGVLGSWDDLKEFVHEKSYPREGSENRVKIWRAGLDTGGAVKTDGSNRTREAYLWLLKNGGKRIFGTKGLGRKGENPSMVKKVDLVKMPGKRGKRLESPLPLYLIDTDQAKDTFFARMDPESRQRLHLTEGIGSDFVEQLMSEDKEVEPRSGKATWVHKRGQNHYLDCSVIAMCAADPQWEGGLHAMKQGKASPKVVVHPSTKIATASRHRAAPTKRRIVIKRRAA